MIEDSKCPCCGAIVMVLVKGTIECFKCPFQCAAKDFPRIAAAMEYAKKTAYWFGLPGGVDHQEDARAEQAMRDAETRVLEVFK